MPRTRRFIRFAAIGLASLAALLAAGMFFLFDANANKARVEAALSQALGMEPNVAGSMGMAYSAGLLVALADVQVRNRGVEVVSARQAGLGFQIVPLLRGDVRFTTLALSHARISVERDREGRFNFQPLSPTQPPPQAPQGGLPALDWPSVSLSDATLTPRPMSSPTGTRRPTSSSPKPGSARRRPFA